MTAARYDIVAKAPGTGVDVGPMIRTLIVDRFSLETHTEDRTMPVYALVAGRTPKAHACGPLGPVRRHPVAQAGSGSAAVPLKTATCTNTTMAEFAQRLHSIAPATNRSSRGLTTEIRGAYDFVVSFTTKNIVGFRKDPSDDPSGAMTVFEAIEKELGLKVDGSKKAQVPVLVIDRAEQIVR